MEISKSACQKLAHVIPGDQASVYAAGTRKEPPDRIALHQSTCHNKATAR